MPNYYPPASGGSSGTASASSVDSAAITDGSIVNADINASAAVAYSKLALTGAILNADVNASAAIAYSKLALTGSIVTGDITDGTILGGDLAPTIAIPAAATATTQTANDNSTKLATTAYVDLADGLDGYFPNSILTPWHPLLASSSTVMSANNAGRFIRVRVKKTGTLTDLALYSIAATDQIDVGIYDTTATTRNRLYHTGAIASPTGGGQWTILTAGSLGVSVTRGQDIEFWVSAAGTTFSILRALTGGAPQSTLPAAFWNSSYGTTNQIISGRCPTVHPLPLNITEANLVTDIPIVGVMCRIV